MYRLLKFVSFIIKHMKTVKEITVTVLFICNYVCMCVFISLAFVVLFQVVPSIINGGITALYFILWGKGLRSCGPLR